MTNDLFSAKVENSKDALEKERQEKAVILERLKLECCSAGWAAFFLGFIIPVLSDNRINKRRISENEVEIPHWENICRRIRRASGPSYPSIDETLTEKCNWITIDKEKDTIRIRLT